MQSIARLLEQLTSLVESDAELRGLERSVNLSADKQTVNRYLAAASRSNDYQALLKAAKAANQAYDDNALAFIDDFGSDLPDAVRRIVDSALNHHFDGQPDVQWALAASLMLNPHEARRSDDALSEILSEYGSEAEAGDEDGLATVFLLGSGALEDFTEASLEVTKRLPTAGDCLTVTRAAGAILTSDEEDSGRLRFYADRGQLDRAWRKQGGGRLDESDADRRTAERSVRTELKSPASLRKLATILRREGRLTDAQFKIFEKIIAFEEDPRLKHGKYKDVPELALSYIQNPNEAERGAVVRAWRGFEGIYGIALTLPVYERISQRDGYREAAMRILDEEGRILDLDEASMKATKRHLTGREIEHADRLAGLIYLEGDEESEVLEFETDDALMTRWRQLRDDYD